MSHAFSVGVFLNILHGTAAEVQPQINHIRSLENVGHIEIWREADVLEPAVEQIIRELAAEYRLIIHAPFINVAVVGHTHLAQASLKLLQDFYDWGLSIGARVFTIHGGHKPFYQNVATDLKLVAQYFSQLRVQPALKCTLEHMPVSKHFSTNPNTIMSLEELEQAVNQLPEFGFTVDFGHVIQNQEQWQDWFERNLHRVYDIHFHDAFLGGKAHLPLGTADFKCAEFFQFLDTHNYQQFMSLEVVGTKEVTQSWQYLNDNNLL